MAQEKKENPMNANPRNHKITARKLRKVYFNNPIFTPGDENRVFWQVPEETTKPD